MEQEIVKADKRYRTRLFSAYGICIVVLSLAIGFGLPPMLAFLRKCNFVTLMNVSEIGTIGFLIFFMGPACYLIYIGRKIILFKRVPYPGQKVIHDSKVITGKKAVLIGRILLTLGIGTICIVVAGAARSFYLFERFRHFNPFKGISGLA
jgi:hypothetical protein